VTFDERQQPSNATVVGQSLMPSFIIFAAVGMWL